MLKLKDSQFPFEILANQLFYFSSIPRSQWRRLDTNPRPWDDEPSVLPPRCRRYNYSATCTKAIINFLANQVIIFFVTYEKAL
jgi:hypothetical protein